jgi:hypothetical protein
VTAQPSQPPTPQSATPPTAQPQQPSPPPQSRLGLLGATASDRDAAEAGGEKYLACRRRFG